MKRPYNMSGRKLLGISGALILVLIFACLFLFSLHRPPSPMHANTSTPLTQSGTRYWIMTSTALGDIATDPKALAALQNDTIYALEYNPGEATVNEHHLHIIPTKVFQSEAQFAADVANGSIPSYVKAILYDNEPWQLTPTPEQQDPISYYKQAFTLAHSHGYTMIATPVPNKIAPFIAKYANIIDVQAQYAQASTSKYLSVVGPIIRQIKQANPQAIILSGMSTNPPAGDPTPQQLYDIANATYASLTRGWWLNIPKPGIACPRCNQPRPGIATSFLRMLGPTAQNTH